MVTSMASITELLILMHLLQAVSYLPHLCFLHADIILFINYIHINNCFTLTTCRRRWRGWMFKKLLDGLCDFCILLPIGANRSATVVPPSVVCHAIITKLWSEFTSVVLYFRAILKLSSLQFQLVSIAHVQFANFWHIY